MCAHCVCDKTRVLKKPHTQRSAAWGCLPRRGLATARSPKCLSPGALPGGRWHYVDAPARQGSHPQPAAKWDSLRRGHGLALPPGRAWHQLGRAQTRPPPRPSHTRPLSVHRTRQSFVGESVHNTERAGDVPRVNAFRNKMTDLCSRKIKEEFQREKEVCDKASR